MGLEYSKTSIHIDLLFAASSASQCQLEGPQNHCHSNKELAELLENRDPCYFVSMCNDGGEQHNSLINQEQTQQHHQHKLARDRVNFQSFQIRHLVVYGRQNIKKLI